MLYCIIGSNSYEFNDEQVHRLCRAVGGQMISMLIDKEPDRHPLHWIEIKTTSELTEDKVKAVFGHNFELRRKKNE